MFLLEMNPASGIPIVIPTTCDVVELDQNTRNLMMGMLTENWLGKISSIIFRDLSTEVLKIQLNTYIFIICVDDNYIFLFEKNEDWSSVFK